MHPFVSGFGLSFSLILAIGAQNAFVLRQGLRGEHVLPVVMVCALSDALLIVAGVAGMGALAKTAPWFAPAMLWGGAAFLIWYGFENFRSAWRGGATLHVGDTVKTGLTRTLATVLALTWLNPHVYLDTVVLMGSIAAQYDDTQSFTLGAVSASFCFFFLLGFGARFLRPVFVSARSWRILDVLVGVTMWAIAIKLVLA